MSALVQSAPAPTLQSLIDQKTLKWIFCGGKGGVGKTTTSCSLAIQLAANRKSVLLISTDPAHNLSDAFGQKFGKDPSPVNGVPNLQAMEVDPSSGMEQLAEAGDDNGMNAMLGDIAQAIPGIDEAMAFSKLLELVNSLAYDVVIFDTAPTGHTLRFLSFPSVLEKALAKFSALSGRLGPMLSSVSQMMGMGSAANIEEMLGKLEGMRTVITEVNRQFADPDLTTFVCVCISEFLSLYETERLIQTLSEYGIDSHSIVVNQLLFPPKENPCVHCTARFKQQNKYLAEYQELYSEDFNIVKVPLLTSEVRGVESLKTFSKNLLEPYRPADREWPVGV